MTISAALFSSTAITRLSEVAAHNEAAVAEAAAAFTASIRAGGIIHAFGTGHSQAGALEVAGRAGGLIPTNRVAISDLVIHGGRPPASLDDPLLERDPSIGALLVELAAIQPADTVVVISNSGVNGAIVEFATRARAAGCAVVAIVSSAHSAAVTPAHPSGARLSDLAHVTLDNGGPVGDALLETTAGLLACGFSSISTALLVQMIVAEVVRTMEAAGEEPPVYVSANLPGGHERNLGFEARYRGRLRRMAS